MTVEQVRKLILAAALAVALLATSCTSSSIGLPQYPDVDPTTDVDYIGEAVSISKPMDDQTTTSTSEQAAANETVKAAD
jgi:hypothetical protein